MHRPLLAAAAAVHLAGSALAVPPATLDADVQAMIAAGPPGLALAIVEDGKPVHVKGYGGRAKGSAAPVGPATLFEIGSTSKAFTAAALAILVDEGKLKWDDRVVDHMPEFQMWDPWVTREMQVRDLLTHRLGLGLGAGDLAIVPQTTHSRPEVVQALRWLKPVSSFRTDYAYSNLAYVAAGQLIERVSGMKWEQFVEARILKPAGMATTLPDGRARYEEVKPVADRALPHARLGPPVRGFGELGMLDERRGLGSNVAPAGGIASNAADMARWVQLQLMKGSVADKPVWSAKAADTMWTTVAPFAIQPAPAPIADITPRFSGYALGWNVRDHGGVKVISHPGGTLGFLAHVVLLPEKKVGFAILMNSEDSDVLQALTWTLIDHYRGKPKSDWLARFSELSAAKRKAAEAALAAAPAAAGPQAPGLPLEAFAGTFRDPWYGDIAVKKEADALVMDFTRTPGMRSRLEPQGGTRFLARWEDATIEPAVVTFEADPAGKVSGARLKAYSPLADFSFDYHDLDLRRVADGR
jgi:CubicO group peptidase (beta-lactamase class C family)